MLPTIMRLKKRLGEAATAAALLPGCVHTVRATCASHLGDPVVSWSMSDNRLTLESGCATVADLVALRTDDNGMNMGPVYHFSEDHSWYTDNYTGAFYLEADLHIVDGSTLSIDGDDPDMDECTTLFLASNSSTIINIRAHGGNLDIIDTKIFSWDLWAADYDRDPETDGRSFISAVTEKITGREEDTCPGDVGGQAKGDYGNAHMDITRSEIGYLGYQASEAYGVSYKARGLCDDHSNLDIYDDDNGLNVGVTGDIQYSELHHNWFGHYSWGHDSGVWQNNEVHDNYGYGFDPHDDSDNLEIVNNIVYNNGWHGIIASKRCTNVLIKNNTIFDNGKHGIMLHRSSDDATVSDNTVFDNGEAGLALFESFGARVFDNIFAGNKYGVRFSVGASNNNIFRNTIEVSEEGAYAIYMYNGTDAPEVEGNDDNYLKDNRIHNNEMHCVQDNVWRIKQADGNQFTRNDVVSGAFGSFDDSTDNKVTSNSFPEGFYFKVSANSCFRNGSQAEPGCY